MNSAVKVEGEQALAAKAWPFEEARKLLARIEARKKAGQTVKGVLFEIGVQSQKVHQVLRSPSRSATRGCYPVG